MVRDVARDVLLGLLVCAAILGLFVDVWAIIALAADEPHGGDHLGKTLPFFALLAFLPVQLAAALGVHGARLRRAHRVASTVGVLEEQPTERAPFMAASAPVEAHVDPNVFERERAQRLARRAQWLLSVPAAAMLLAELTHAVGLRSVYFTLSEPMSLLWVPSWCAGIVVAVVALARYDRWDPLALALLYPAVVQLVGFH